MRLKRIHPFILATKAMGFGYALTVRGTIALSYGVIIGSTGLLIARFPGPGLAVATLGIASQFRRRGKPGSGAYGTARWATTRELIRNRLLGGSEGIILGRADPVAGNALGKLSAIFTTPLADSANAVRRFFADGKGELIRVKEFTHAATVAPTGSGKGTSYIIPNLLSHPGSVVIFDPKLENYLRTAQHRAKRFGHQVVLLNFFGHGSIGSDCFNPMDLIDRDSPEALDLCRAMGDAMVERTGEERDPHFNDSASLFISGVIAWVAAHGCPEQRHLQTVREVLVSPQATARALAHMATSDAMGGMLRRQAFGISHYRDRELGSVMTTVGRSLQWLDSVGVSKHMRNSTFDPKALRRTGKMSIYICIPEHLIATNRGLLRLLFGSLLRAVTTDGAKLNHG